MLRRIIDADNNCLFNAISYAIERCFNPEQYRQIISSHVMANTHTFTAPILEGKEPSVYSEWILKNTSWGGALELHIFSQYFALQIAAVSIQTLNVHIFGIVKLCVLYNCRKVCIPIGFISFMMEFIMMF
jgi:ubiquitin thioesterase OTU1